MPNFATLSDREFTPYCKYDARAGRWSSKTEDGSLFDVPQLTAIFDLPQLQTGWIQFNEGAAPDFVFDDANGNIKPRPVGKFKRGFVVNLFSQNALGGVREFASNSGVVSQGMQELYAAFENAPERSNGLVPVVKFTGSSPVKSGKSTNYQPHFVIEKWVPRPAALPAGVAAAPASEVPPPVQSAAAATPPPWQSAAAATPAPWQSAAAATPPPWQSAAAATPAPWRSADAATPAPWQSADAGAEEF